MIVTAGSAPAVFSVAFSFASSQPPAIRHTRKMLSLSSLFRMSFFHKLRDYTSRHPSKDRIAAVDTDGGQ